MLAILIVFAYLFGLFVSLFKLPPMVGFLLAGFAYKASGLDVPNGIEEISELGITLLLFSIGLKLDLKSLMKSEIWLGSSLHILITTLFYTVIIFLLKENININCFNISFFTIVILSFALSFSSTVFAVKVLEEKSNLHAFFGKVAIGILVMQDIFAVVFLSISEGKVPNIWAISLIGLPLLKPIIYKILDKSGHGELLVLSSLFLALGVGAGGFKLMGLKPDLGALVMGILASGHTKSTALAKSFFNLKEVLLVGFFLSIGLNGFPNLYILGISLFLCLLLPFKTSFYFLILSRFGLRTRSNLLSCLALANYSEFGLIVAAIGVSRGWLPVEWLLILALAISISFVIASPINSFSEIIYRYTKPYLDKFQTSHVHPEERHIHIGKAKYIIIGMGRVGFGVYTELVNLGKKDIVGIEHDQERVQKLQDKGVNVILGDGGDSDFWLRLKLDDALEHIFLALPIHKMNIFAVRQIQKLNIPCKITAIARFPEEVHELKELGVNAFNIYNESGAGLARHALRD